MLTDLEKILFALMAAETLILTYMAFRLAARTIERGGGTLSFENSGQRLLRALEVTFSQRTVFRTRLGTSLLHGFVVWGFLFYGLVNIGDVIEGFYDLNFLGMGLIGDFYRLVADVLSLLVLIGVAYFLVRRFLVRDPALTINRQVKLHEKAAEGIRRDSLIVGIFILVHIGARFLGETFWIALRDGDGWQPIAGTVALMWGGLSHDALEVSEHVAWWVALGSILLFLPYFPYTKHMHLFMGPLNYMTQPARTSLGALDPLDFEDEEIEQFGAARLEHLSQTQIFDAFACIMCNRCQDVCPAYVTGKELSPAALEINKRFEIKHNMSSLAAGDESPRSLLDFAISESAVWACTACGACVEICPVGNEPMFDIIDIRRDRVLMESEFPAELQGAFRGMENNGNPWQMGESRMAWAEGLDVPLVEDVNGDYEVLYWVGCAGSFEPRAQKIAQALVQVLNAAGVKFAVLGESESCTGDTARRAGNEYLFYEIASANIEILNEAAPPRILVTCPHCLHTLGKEYPQFGGNYDVVHHTTFIQELLENGRLKLSAPTAGDADRVTFHDPCYLGRHNGEYDAPRRVLQAAGINLTEMQRIREDSFCCGAGGGQFWKEEEHGAARVNLARYAEASQTGAGRLAVGCPFCLRMLDDASNDESTSSGPTVSDVVEIIAERLPVRTEAAED